MRPKLRPTKPPTSSSTTGQRPGTAPFTAANLYGQPQQRIAGTTNKKNIELQHQQHHQRPRSGSVSRDNHRRRSKTPEAASDEHTEEGGAHNAATATAAATTVEDVDKHVNDARKKELEQLNKLREKNLQMQERQRKEEDTALKNRRAAEERRRREEAEIRLMIHAEIEKSKVYQARIVQNEAQLSKLSRTVDKTRESNEVERADLSQELQQWNKKVSRQQSVVDAKQTQLKELLATVANLNAMRNQSKMCLTSHFLRQDMKVDFDVNPAEIFSVAAASTVSRDVAEGLTLAKKARLQAAMVCEAHLESGSNTDEDAVATAQISSGSSSSSLSGSVMDGDDNSVDGDDVESPKPRSNKHSDDESPMEHSGSSSVHSGGGSRRSRQRRGFSLASPAWNEKRENRRSSIAAAAAADAATADLHPFLDHIKDNIAQAGKDISKKRDANTKSVRMVLAELRAEMEDTATAAVEHDAEREENQVSSAEPSPKFGSGRKRGGSGSPSGSHSPPHQPHARSEGASSSSQSPLRPTFVDNFESTEDTSTPPPSALAETVSEVPAATDMLSPATKKMLSTTDLDDYRQQ